MKRILFFSIVGVLLAVGGIFIYAKLMEDDPRVVKDRAEKRFEEYLDNWGKQDFAQMYEQLALDTKKNMTKAAFISRYETIYNGMEANHVQVKNISMGRESITKDEELHLSYQVSMNTVAGPLTFTHKLTMVRENQSGKKDWYIKWNESLIFPSMKEKDKVRVQTILPQRGEIVDRNGILLATTGVAYEVGLIPEKWEKNSDGQKQKTAALLDMTVEQIAAKRNAKWVKPELFVPLATQAKEDDRLDQLEKIEGLMLRKKQVRYYPYRQATAHLIGYIGSMNEEQWKLYEPKGYRATDLVGKAGVEQVYEEQLHGTPGARIIIADEQGQEKEVLAKKLAQDGQKLALTIDADLQFAIYEEMKNDAGTAAAIHPLTGEVLAMLSTPAYDPNAFIRGLSNKEWTRLNDDPAKPLLNRFAIGFAPGSTFKPITAAIGLEQGSIQPEQGMTVKGLHWQKDSSWGKYRVTRVKDPHSPVTLEKALVYSDNIYFAQAALQMGQQVFLEGAKKFGIGENLPVTYPLRKSKIANQDIRNEIQLADSGYGQGEVTMTPLHLALTYSAFVNAGNIVYPALTQQEVKPQAFWKENVMSKETAALIKADLIQVMENSQGTGRFAKPSGIRVAGKTGTAELKAKKGEDGLEYGWMAVFNVDKPKLLLTMMIENVKGRGGSHYLDPKVKRIFAQETGRDS
ncbi:penicillin-binding transpeptidase domain-containing protein [Brevibacillus laterosporus]|uniref:penicillin-binding transpeptidase domain-containing protein n=1 Tax=Brevibacillus laterosporus TaxID=1465 RepID=UPI0026523E37|nr:penicillin-binding transpeptidase domain-containing protein [Brevibacillus laterosporus]MDN9011389.1 penicillin-binding transpeptidase domain-containing protein [Brevibacillus laterosporus]MDO0942433.1 penicillin-binding transpeptidase domain-containing protein [Brevibacillus laterosporus]